MTVDVYVLCHWRLDNLIMEAISNLREPGGSNKTSIATYIEVIYIFFTMSWTGSFICWLMQTCSLFVCVLQLTYILGITLAKSWKNNEEHKRITFVNYLFLFLFEKLKQVHYVCWYFRDSGRCLSGNSSIFSLFHASCDPMGMSGWDCYSRRYWGDNMRLNGLWSVRNRFNVC